MEKYTVLKGDSLSLVAKREGWNSDEVLSLNEGVDLDNTQVCLENGQAISFPIDSFARYCLLNGVDQLSYLLNHDSEISAYENKQQ